MGYVLFSTSPDDKTQEEHYALAADAFNVAAQRIDAKHKHVKVKDTVSSHVYEKQTILDVQDLIKEGVLRFPEPVSR